MSPKKEIAIAGHTFEELKQINEHGAEYWSARSLQPLLGYSQWRRFEQTIKRAVSSCKKSGNPPNYHFAGAGKPITANQRQNRRWKGKNTQTGNALTRARRGGKIGCGSFDPQRYFPPQAGAVC